MKHKIFINAISSILQIIVVTIIYFILYKYLIEKIGIDYLGIWSLILASTSILNISNLGFSSSVIKYVAKYKALNESQKIFDIIQTSLITVALVSGIALIILFPFANFILKFIIPSKYIIIGQNIIPYSFLNLWFNIVSGIFLATLDGFQRIEIKNFVLIISSILYVVLSFILVPKYGLFGVVYAQITQVILTFILSIIVVKIIFPEYQLLKFLWKKKIFKEIFNYSIQFQLITIAQLLYDPITKGLITKFGGLAATGYYEMAYRLIIRVRSLIISANQVLVPTYATLNELNIENVQTLYLSNLNYIHYLTTPVFIFMIAITPLVSQIWVGKQESIFMLSMVVLSISWGINIYSAPAYFANLGIGKLNWNLLSHILMGILNLFLGFIMGFLGGASFVVCAWGLSLILGSIVLPLKFHKESNVKTSILKNKENIKIIIWNLVAFGFSWVLYFYFITFLTIIQLVILTLFFYIIVSGYSIWNHSVRRKLTKRFKEIF